MHTLLVAEDTAHLPPELHDVVERRGHRVTRAESFSIAIARQQVDPADIFVIDWASARAPSAEALGRVTRGVPTIVLALVRPETNDLAEAIDVGVNDYLTVPLAPPAIAARFAIVERWLELLRARDANHHVEHPARSILDADLRTILDACPDPICIHRQRTIVYANPSLAGSLKFGSPAEMIGVPIEQIVHPDDRPSIEERLELLERTGLPMPRREERFLARDGSIRVGEAHSFVIRFGDGTALVSLGRDLTDTRALEARLRHSERLAAVGTIAASVAHELNNPLTLVLCNLADLSYALPALGAHVPGELAARLEQRVHAIEEAATQMQGLARDLTDFVRAKEDSNAKIDLRLVLERSARMVAAYARGQAGVVIEAELEDVGMVTSSETRLLQVFLNLLINAVDAVGSCPETDERRIVIRLRREGGEAVATIADTGPGIPMDMRAHVFEPFFSTKPRGKGTGLGLSIVETVIAGAGGTIAVRDAPKGATFEVRLPLAEQARSPS